MQLKSGAILQNGKYRIVRTLGQGGFGITYEAEHVLLRSKVAIKEFFMKGCCMRNNTTSFVTVGTDVQRALVEKFQGKFIREAQMMHAMAHPNIVRVTDVFEENGTAYYVMDILPGGSLADKVKMNGRLSEPLAEKYIQQVADALAYIHSQNTVHLDVKPDNVLLNAKGDAVLIDFGISKHYDGAGEQTSSTPVGITKGYAPLEQGLNGNVSHFKPSTDIYALGATLYYLVTGLVPPDASLIFEDGLSRPNGISDKIWHTIEQAMRPSRNDRLQSVEAFLAALNEGTSNPDNAAARMGLPAGSTLHNGKYEIVRPLDQNAYEITYLGKMKRSHNVVIREFYLDSFFARMDGGQVAFVDMGISSLDDDLIAYLFQHFYEDAQLFAGFNHPYIVKVFDVFKEKGTAYYVTNDLSGGSLLDKIQKDGPLSERQAERYIRQVGNALSFIHAENLVHKDVTPSRILISDQEEAVLLNPGSDCFAHEFFRTHLDEDSSPASPGNPYQAIELHSRCSLGISTDIYALGATFYYLVTGDNPPMASAVLEDGLNRPSGVSDRIWRVIERAMSPARKDRPQSIADFFALLDIDNQASIVDADSQGPINVPTSGQTTIGHSTLVDFQIKKGWKKYGIWSGVAFLFVLGLLYFFYQKKKPIQDSLLINGMHVCRVDLESTASEQTFIIEKNFEERWIYYGVPDWFTAKGEEGKLILTITENKTKNDRTATIIFQKKGGTDVLGNLIIIQRAKGKPVKHNNRVEKATTGSLNQHTWMDLGLSVKWATCNVGASSPNQYGSYFAWGETKSKSDYSWTDYVFRDSGDTYDYVKLSKYNSNSGRGVVDKKKQLELDDDVAHICWGDGWRMPTRAEMTELRTKCVWTWTTLGGINGYEVKSMTNNNSIFLPVAGYRKGESYLVNAGKQGYYWTSTLYTKASYNAWEVFFNSSEVFERSSGRSFGQSVRPVTE